MNRHAARSLLAGALVVLTIAGVNPSRALAAGINTDVALTPPQGGTIVRAQWRYSELSDDPTPLDREVKLSIEPISIVHGFTESFDLLGTVPIVHQRVEFGSGGAQTADGIGDITLLAKYRFFREDQPGQTTRWAVIGGAEVPTYDDDFSSDSFDPIIGTVWTYQQRDWFLDWDLLYKLNTAGGIDGDDELRADVSYSHLLLGGESKAFGPWGLYGLAEIDASYLTDGSTEVFGSPGIQLITSRLILEAGVQLPLYQEMQSPRLETDFTAVVSLRFQF